MVFRPPFGLVALSAGRSPRFCFGFRKQRGKIMSKDCIAVLPPTDSEVAQQPWLDTQSEQVVLGWLLIDGAARRSCRLSEADFLHVAHAMIFRAIFAVERDGCDVDILTVSSRLNHEDSGEATKNLRYLNDLVVGSPALASYEAHERLVIRAASRRALRRELSLGDPNESIANLVQRVRATCSRIEAKDSAQAHLEFVSASSLSPEDLASGSDALVDGLLLCGSLTAVYGPPNCGKTYLAVDLACAVALGAKWNGRRTKRGLVVYVAAEAPWSVGSRVLAYRKSNGVDLDDLYIVKAAPDFHQGDHGARQVIQLCELLERTIGRKVELIIFDTLSRIAPGADENNAADMMRVVARVDLVRTEVRASCLLVHHSGKDVARGMRGSSTLRAAVDTEVLVVSSAKEKLSRATVTKQRDLDAAASPPICYRMQHVAIGTTAAGKEWGACVVEYVDHAESPTVNDDAGLSGVAKLTIDYVTQHREVSRAELVDHIVRVARRSKSAAYAAISELIRGGTLTTDGKSIALP